MIAVRKNLTKSKSIKKINGGYMDIICTKCNKRMDMCSRCEPLSSHAGLAEVRHGLEEFMKGIDGRIDGHSWGAQETGKSKVSIEDLQEIYDEIEEIFKKHFG